MVLTITVVMIANMLPGMYGMAGTGIMAFLAYFTPFRFADDH
jgi:hypothetical protein